MIYISSASVGAGNVRDSVESLVLKGIKNIELSYWGSYYEGLLEELLTLKEKYQLNYMTHNYFYPIKDEFVLNLASLDDQVYEKSYNYIRNAILAAKRMGSDKYSFHAGFLVDIEVEELGRKVATKELFDKGQALDRFCLAYKRLSDIAKDVGIVLYVENNVLSKTNLESFKQQNPFLLVNYADYAMLKKMIDFKLLLDVGHLKATACSLSLSFPEELDKLISQADYLHLSDNQNGRDAHEGISEESELYGLLSKYELKAKTLTLEINSGMSMILETYNLFKRTPINAG